MKKSYKFDSVLGVIKCQYADIKNKDLDEHEKLQGMDLPKGTPPLVYEASDIVVDLGVLPIIMFSQGEVCLYEESNVAKTTNIFFMDGSSEHLLIPFEEFEKFFISYKRVVFE